MFHPKPLSALLPTLRETPETVKTQALEFLEATNSPATAATITSFWTGLELTSSQLNYLKRKKDNSEGIKHKSFADDLLAYLGSRSDVSYMCTTWCRRTYWPVETKGVLPSNKR
jgi:hypothetical protein